MHLGMFFKLLWADLPLMARNSYKSSFVHFTEADLDLQLITTAKTDTHSLQQDEIILSVAER